MVNSPERIWAAKVTDNYGEWQISKDGLPRPVEYVRAEAAERLAGARVKATSDELSRYIERCRELSDGGEYSWWSRLAEILSALAEPAGEAVTEAAGPFVTFANHAIEKTDDGWVWRTSGNERICDWFGPSDFGALKAAMEAEG